MSQSVVNRLRKSERLLNARTLLLYSPLPDEVDISTLLDSLAQSGRTVVLPKVIDSENMELRLYTGRQDLTVGAYGIMEPTGDLFTALDNIDTAIIPGMAFDRSGHRLGRGKGYYDRMLAKMPNTYKIGICFGFQLVDEVPSDGHDIVMDEIIS